MYINLWEHSFFLGGGIQKMLVFSNFLEILMVSDCKRNHKTVYRIHVKFSILFKKLIRFLFTIDQNYIDFNVLI